MPLSCHTPLLSQRSLDGTRGDRQLIRSRSGYGASVPALSLASALLLTGSLLATARPAAAQADFLPASAAETASLPGILVQGIAEIQVTPDIARVTLGVQTAGKRSQEVAQENARKSSAVLAAIKALGIADKDIRTAGYSVGPEYEYNNGTQKLTGYRASNSIVVTIHDLARVGAILDAGTNAGANIADGMSFELENPEAAQQEALRKAATNALGKARALASALGATNLVLTSVQESNVSPIQPLAFARAKTDQVATPIQPGQQTVIATVLIRFRFTPAVP